MESLISSRSLVISSSRLRSTSSETAFFGSSINSFSDPADGGVMRKLVGDFLYYLRRGYGIRESWRLALVTL